MLQELEDEKETVLVFGHNPTVYYYMHYLLHHFNDDVPTCSTVGIDFGVESWSQLRANAGEMHSALSPICSDEKNSIRVDPILIFFVLILGLPLFKHFIFSEF